MNLTTTKQKSVAILLTGDEIVDGDLSDGNGMYMAQVLFDRHIVNGLRLCCRDDEMLLTQCMDFLLSRHEALITVGGLGPTSDDLTRFALANITGQALHLHEPSWRTIQERFQNNGRTPSPANRQQALFPARAQVLPNANGSAPGCTLHHDGKWIFMLPGPPRECQPIFDKQVLPTLLQNDFSRELYRRRWTVSGIAESALADKLDPLLKQHRFSLGYRARKPQVEIKVVCDDETVFNAICTEIERHVQPYLVDENAPVDQR